MSTLKKELYIIFWSCLFIAGIYLASTPLDYLLLVASVFIGILAFILWLSLQRKERNYMVILTYHLWKQPDKYETRYLKVKARSAFKAKNRAIREVCYGTGPKDGVKPSAILNTTALVMNEVDAT